MQPSTSNPHGQTAENASNDTPTFTINMPEFNALLASNNIQILEMDPNEDDFLLKALTQTENILANKTNETQNKQNQNKNIKTTKQTTKQNPTEPAKNSENLPISTSGDPTINSLTQNMQQNNFHPAFVPRMFFPQSNVTINYHINTK